MKSKTIVIIVHFMKSTHHKSHERITTSAFQQFAVSWHDEAAECFAMQWGKRNAEEEEEKKREEKQKTVEKRMRMRWIVKEEDVDMKRANMCIVHVKWKASTNGNAHKQTHLHCLHSIKCLVRMLHVATDETIRSNKWFQVLEKDKNIQMKIVDKYGEMTKKLNRQEFHYNFVAKQSHLNETKTRIVCSPFLFATLLSCEMLVCREWQEHGMMMHFSPE